MWSRLSAHLQPFFLALSAYFNNFRQKIPYFDVSRQKRVLLNCFATKQCLGMLKCEASLFFGSYLLSHAYTGSLWLLVDLSLSLSGSLWLSVTPTLAPTGSHRHSLDYSGPLWLIIALQFRLYSQRVIWSARATHAF